MFSYLYLSLRPSDHEFHPSSPLLDFDHLQDNHRLQDHQDLQDHQVHRAHC